MPRLGRELNRVQRLSAEKEIVQVLLSLRELLAQHSIECYLSGGFVRDALMGRATGDVDLVVQAKALELAPELARVLGGRYVPLDEVNEIARVVLRGERNPHLDLSTMRASIEEDLAQRDFTIDAIAINLREIED
ncbi:MAG: hypothetical protein ACE5H6_02245, partial [Dehalococcoidia bacterium]